jgi:putative ABC transport system substrate-binding protein
VKSRLFTIALRLLQLAAPGHSVCAQDVLQKEARVGIVFAESNSTVGPNVAAIRNRLRELNWAEGRNLVLETRFAEGHLERLPALVDELLLRKVDVIITGGNPTVLAVKRATSTIPIVVVAMSDPVELGLVLSLSRPGGNLTGLSLGFSGGFAGKWLELLHEMVPRLSALAVVFNPENTASARYLADLEAAAAARGIKLRSIGVYEAPRLEHAFQQAKRSAQAVLVLPDPFVMYNRRRIVALAQQHRLPAMYGLLEFTDDGGLIAYGVDLVATSRRGAEIADKILRGANPGDIPIEQPTKFSLAVNLKTAQELEITIPESILLRADEVIK